jgi:hypothetical protein
MPCSLITDVSEEITTSIIALITKAARTSESSVNVYQTTWCSIPEDGHLYNRRRENLNLNRIGVSLSI